MTLPIPTPSDLAQRFAAALSGQDFTASDGTSARLDATAPQTLEQAISIANALDLYQVYLYVRDIGLELMVSTATVGGLLPRHAQQWSVPREGATAAVGYFIVSASDKVSIPAGALLTVDGSAQWSVDEDVTIAAGASASVAVTAMATGTTGNLAANTAATFVSPISGVVSITSDQHGIAGGAPIEDGESWRNRIIASIRAPGGTGLVSDYIEWAREGGAAYVTVVPPATGGNNIGIFVMMANGAVPTPAQVAAIQSVVDTKRPLCARPTVYAGQISVQNLTIQLRPDSVVARAKVTNALAAFFLGGGLGATLYRDAVAATIASVNGMSNDLITPDDDIALAANQLAQLGTITWHTAS